MSLRTYCVIPHRAREETSFFQGVFEDGVRVLYQGRLQSLLFSHVLSPAHDYVKHINGPLLATLQEGGNATLLVAIPNSEETPSSGPSLSTSSSVAVKSDGIVEAAATAMGLYRELFPLLFRNLPSCAEARVSVVTASASDRVLLDNLDGDVRLSDVPSARQMILHRRSSATAWGTLLRLLEDRHNAMAESSTSLAGQTACVVTVDLENYGRLVVVDTASSQELLQQLTLLLGMDCEGDARTYPPHTLLRDLLAQNVPPKATVQVLCLPAPQDTARQTMRVLHFGSTVEAWRSKLEASNTVNTDAFIKKGSGSSASCSLLGAEDGHRRLGESRATLLSRTAPSRSVSFSVDRARSFASKADPYEGSNRSRSSSSGSGSSCSTTSAIGPARYTASREEVGNVTLHSSHHYRDSTPAQLPPPSLTTAAADDRRQRARELEDAQLRQQQLRRRVAVLEGRVKDLEVSNTALQAARDAAVREKEQVAVEMRTKSSTLVDLQRAHHKAKQENADYAQLVQKLLQQIRVLEKDTGRQKRQDMAVVKELQQVRDEKTELELQLARLRKEVMLFRRDATYRAREATLSRIVPNSVSIPAQGATAAAARTSSSSTWSSRRARLKQLQEQASVLSPGSTSALAGGGRGQRAASLLGSRQLNNDRGGVHNSSSSRRSSPRARRLYDTSTDDDEDGRGEKTSRDGGDKNRGRGGAITPISPHLSSVDPAQRVTDITVEELRWRNRHLEQEVTRLQERLLSFLTATPETAHKRSIPSSSLPPTSQETGDGVPSSTCATCAVMRERLTYFQKELARVRDEKDRLLDLLRISSKEEVGLLDGRGSTRGDDMSSATRSAAERKKETKEGGRHTREGSPEHDRDSRLLRLSSSAPTLVEGQTTHGVAAALLAGCSSLQAQLGCAEAVLNQRLHHTKMSDTAAQHTDPLSRLSARVLLEHREAVAALAESLQHIAEKPATSPSLFATSSLSDRSHARGSSDSRQQLSLLPPVPRTATAGNAEILANYLTFEAERCRHLRAFIPTFAQLAVATEHLLMRLEATEPDT